MRFSLKAVLAAAALPAFVAAAPADVPSHLKGKRSTYVDNGVERTVFEHEATGAKLDFVTNSGICETTAGVNQYSGYLSVGNNMNMWFWFFEARSNATSAPLATWFNGGPGCSSMIGLFQVFRRTICLLYDCLGLISLGKWTLPL
jgi:carboxypeptidase C (cathepsin A)